MAEESLLPFLNIRATPAKEELGNQPVTVEIRVPSAQVMIDKETLDGLQVWGDDCSQWADRVLGGGRGQTGMNTRNPSIIGSRYFAKPPKSLGSSRTASIRGMSSDAAVRPAEVIISLAVAESQFQV